VTERPDDAMLAGDALVDATAIVKDPRAYSKWMAGEDRGALRGDGRRDQIMEREQAFWAAVARDLGRAELGPGHSPHKRLGYRQTVMLPGLR
jgi:hypothetical protein